MMNKETFPEFLGVPGAPVNIKRTTPLARLRLLFATKTPALETRQSLLLPGIVPAPTTFKLALVRGLARYTALVYLLPHTPLRQARPRLLELVVPRYNAVLIAKPGQRVNDRPVAKITLLASTAITPGKFRLLHLVPLSKLI